MDDVNNDDHLSIDDLVNIFDEGENKNPEMLSIYKDHIKKCDSCRNNYEKFRRLYDAFSLYKEKDRD